MILFSYTKDNRGEKIILKSYKVIFMLAVHC